VDLVRKADGTAYVVYSPFKRQWLAQPLPEKQDVLPAPSVINSDVELDGQPIPASPIPIDDLTFAPGEDEALRRLQSFVMGDPPIIYGYANNRDLPGVEGTSQLSPYLRFGMLSARRAVVAARYAIRTAPTPEARKGAETWLSELIWRDFYISILNQFPQVRGASFRPEYDQIQWRNNEDEFAAWCEGRTGYPFVDAAMRQLRAIGWMHNRARMVTASFLVKDLLVDWRWGGTLVYAAIDRRRSGRQQRRLAVGGRNRHRRRALFPGLQSRNPEREVRSRGKLHPALGFQNWRRLQTVRSMLPGR
jgi:deoxyribodipyrimidine photo-lyase